MIDIQRFIRAFGFAFAGLRHAFRYDQNLRFHAVMALLVIAASIFFHVSHFEMGILGVMILLVMATEMINTAIEQMVNLITKEHHQEAKIAKDVSSGMVLLTAMGSLIVGILIFVPYILHFFQVI